MSHQATRKSYGPFLVKAAGSSMPIEFFALPWAEVKGAVILISDSDDIDTNPASATTALPQLMVSTEVSLFGVIQGYETRLKTFVINGKSGPGRLVLPWEEGYERISFRQRLMNGGIPLILPQGSNAGNQAGLVNVNMNVFVFPRGGFKDVING